MNTIRLVVTVCAMMLSLLTLQGQGEFEDLDFESAYVISDPSNPYNGYYIVPAWAMNVGTISSTFVQLNSPAIGSSSITLFGSNASVIEGSYSIYLQGAGALTPSGPVNVSISQTGVVPVDAMSLWFAAQHGGSGDLLVSLGGNALSYGALSSGPDFTLYWADISTYAGQELELTFLAPGGLGNNWTLDSISFSSTAVPEPGAACLTALGVAGFIYLRRQMRRP